MNFAGIGPAELLVILIVALLVFGPTKLPEIARDLGNAMQKWRHALDDITVDALSEKPAPPSGEAEMQTAVQKVVRREPQEEEEEPSRDDQKGEDTVDTECQK